MDVNPCDSLAGCCTSVKCCETQNASKHCKCCGTMLHNVLKNMDLERQESWATATGGLQRVLRRARTVATGNGRGKSTRRKLEVIENAGDQPTENVSASESEKLGLAVLCDGFNEGLENIPFKKRRFPRMRSTSPRTTLLKESRHSNGDLVSSGYSSSDQKANHERVARTSSCLSEALVEPDSDPDFTAMSMLAEVACEVDIKVGSVKLEHSVSNDKNCELLMVTQSSEASSLSEVKEEILQISEDFARQNGTSAEALSTHDHVDNSCDVKVCAFYRHENTPISSGMEENKGDEPSVRSSRLHWDLNVEMEAWDCSPDNKAESGKLHVDAIVNNDDSKKLNLSNVSAPSADLVSFSLGQLLLDDAVQKGVETHSVALAIARSNQDGCPSKVECSVDHHSSVILNESALASFSVLELEGMSHVDSVPIAENDHIASEKPCELDPICMENAKLPVKDVLHGSSHPLHVKEENISECRTNDICSCAPDVLGSATLLKGEECADDIAARTANDVSPTAEDTSDHVVICKCVNVIVSSTVRKNETCACCTKELPAVPSVGAVDVFQQEREECKQLMESMPEECILDESQSQFTTNPLVGMEKIDLDGNDSQYEDGEFRESTTSWDDTETEDLDFYGKDNDSIPVSSKSCVPALDGDCSRATLDDCADDAHKTRLAVNSDELVDADHSRSREGKWNMKRDVDRVEQSSSDWRGKSSRWDRSPRIQDSFVRRNSLSSKVPADLARPVDEQDWFDNRYTRKRFASPSSQYDVRKLVSSRIIRRDGSLHRTDRKYEQWRATQYRSSSTRRGSPDFCRPFNCTGPRNAASAAAAKVESNGFVVSPDGTIRKVASTGSSSHRRPRQSTDASSLLGERSRLMLSEVSPVHRSGCADGNSRSHFNVRELMQDQGFEVARHRSSDRYSRQAYDRRPPHGRPPYSSVPLREPNTSPKRGRFHSPRLYSRSTSRSRSRSPACVRHHGLRQESRPRTFQPGHRNSRICLPPDGPHAVTSRKRNL